MSNVRLRRLQADFEKVRDFAKRHPRVKLIQSEGDPPELYQIEFRIRSLKQSGTELVEAKSHLVEIALPRNYPRTPPHCRMLTPIFHPNIAPHAICIGDHWSAGEPLAAIIARIGELISYQSYNTKSPLNGEAARWVDQHLDELPLDPVSMMLEDAAPDEVESEPDAEPRVSVAGPDSPAPDPQVVERRQPQVTQQVRGQTASLPRPLPQTPESATAQRADRGLPVKAPAAPGGVAGDATIPVAPCVEKLTFKCPECAATIRTPADRRGRPVRCPRCDNVISVPLA